jgi:hypothetical protein
MPCNQPSWLEGKHTPIRSGLVLLSTHPDVIPSEPVLTDPKGFFLMRQWEMSRVEFGSFAIFASSWLFLILFGSQSRVSSVSEERAMNYYPMTTKQLEQEQSSLQVKVRNAAPSESWEELAKLGRVQAILSDRYAQSVKAHIAERVMWVQ